MSVFWCLEFGVIVTVLKNLYISFLFYINVLIFFTNQEGESTKKKNKCNG